MKPHRTGLLMLAATLAAWGLSAGAWVVLAPQWQEGSLPSSGVGLGWLVGLTGVPVIALAAAFLAVRTHELRPLRDLMSQLEAPAGSRAVEPAVAQLHKHLRKGQARLRQLEAEHLDAIAANRLSTYRKDKAEAVLQALPDGVLVLDEACRATFANGVIEGLLGLPLERVVGQPPKAWCTLPALLAFVQRLRLRAGEPAPRPAKGQLVIEGNPPRFLTLTSHPLRMPQERETVFGTLVVIRDTTQEQLARSAGADFVSHVSHELKTPLASIVAYSELLMGDDGHDASLRVEAVNVMHDEAERMAGLINNLLSISKIDSGAMTLKRQRVNLHDLLVDAFESQRQGALGKGLDFRLDVPPNLGAAALDKDLFRIAINNVIGNAIKYNKAGGQVSLSAEEADDQTLAIHVRDSGIGIPADQRERIFDKYYRVPDEAGGEGALERKGHGLGLYLVRQIVELHQGRITVDSQPGRGTEFCIRVRKLAAVYEEAIAA